MTWYSYVFPNTALCTATFAIAKALDSRAIRITGCVMTCVLICIWLTVFVCMVRAVFLRDILWPQKQEDRDEGGWKGKISDERGDERTLHEEGEEEQADGDEGGSALSRVVSALSQRSRRKRKNTTGSNV